MRRKRTLLVIAGVIGITLISQAQAKIDSAERAGQYHVNYWASIGGLAAAFFVTTEGHDRVNDRPRLSEALLNSLDPDKVPGFDRISLRQDVSRYQRALEISDYGIQYAPLLPALLFIDKRMRKDWLDIAIVYAETQVAVLNVYNYTFLGPSFIKRYRPIVYYDNVPLEEREFPRNRNSFYSGHTSTVSAMTFFSVNTFLSYHPEYEGSKLLLYGLATLPAAYVGIKRIQGLKHYPSDVIVGCIVGAAGGILWPKLHQKTRQKATVSMVYGPDLKMMQIKWEF